MVSAACAEKGKDRDRPAAATAAARVLRLKWRGLMVKMSSEGLKSAGAAGLQSL